MLTCDDLKVLCPDVPDEVLALYGVICNRWGDVVFTGSRAIGCAKKESDWDFVVADKEDFELPVAAGINHDSRGTVSHNNTAFITSVRVGKVNLIVDHRGSSILDNWRIATDYCQEHAVFNRNDRVKVFKEMGT